MTDDAHTWECPDCQASLPIGILKCKRCGYVQTKAQAAAQAKGVEINQKFCSYVSMQTGKQCPLPGDISHSIKGSRYCGDHVKNPSGPEAEMIYRENVQNYAQIMSDMKNDFHHDPVAWYARNKDTLEAARAKNYLKTSQPDTEADEEREAIQNESNCD